MESYEQKYKEALKRASKLKVQNPFDTVGQMVEHIFPDLQENEDERIRKAIKKALQVRCDGSRIISDEPVTLEEAIAWLEKQEFYTFEIKEGHWYKCVCDYMPNGSDLMFKNDRLYYCRRDWRLTGEIDERNVKNIGVNGYKSFFRPATNQEIQDWFEKQDENNPTDKVEPKFKVGDFIVNGYCSGKVIEITNDAYLLDTGQGILLSCEHNVHLWSINDAKDGDVLANDHHILILKELGYDWSCNGTPNSVKAYCGIKPNGNFELDKDNWSFCGTLHIHPATKEQRDFLFQKMKEAGYKWDANKKELKKIEPKTIDADKVINWVNPNKVIEWLKNTIKETEEYLGEYGEYYDIHLTLPYDSIEDLIDDFKKNFKL